jgi:hypothetical protein
MRIGAALERQRSVTPIDRIRFSIADLPWQINRIFSLLLKPDLDHGR